MVVDHPFQYVWMYVYICIECNQWDNVFYVECDCNQHIYLESDKWVTSVLYLDPGTAYSHIFVSSQAIATTDDDTDISVIYINMTTRINQYLHRGK